MFGGEATFKDSIDEETGVVQNTYIFKDNIFLTNRLDHLYHDVDNGDITDIANINDPGNLIGADVSSGNRETNL